MLLLTMLVYSSIKGTLCVSSPRKKAALVVCLVDKQDAKKEGMCVCLLYFLFAVDDSLL